MFIPFSRIILICIVVSWQWSFEVQNLPFPGLQLTNLCIEHTLSILGDTKVRIRQYQHKLQYLFTIDASRRENLVVVPLYLPRKRNMINVEFLYQQSINKRSRGSSYNFSCFVGCENTKGLYIIKPPVSKEVPVGDASRLQMIIQYYRKQIHIKTMFRRGLKDDSKTK